MARIGWNLPTAIVVLPKPQANSVSTSFVSFRATKCPSNSTPTIFPAAGSSGEGISLLLQASPQSNRFLNQVLSRSQLSELE